jgi:hypothetical protein
MPKPLARQQPSSSVARLLEPGIAAGALAPVKSERVEEPILGTLQESERNRGRGATGEIANITRQFIVTESTDEILKQLVQLYSRAIGSQLTNSHVLRAILKGVAHAMPELEREAERLGRIKRPRNVRGKEHERELFERRIATAFMAGMRAASVYE